MEAQKTNTKPQRLSQLSFETSFILSIQMRSPETDLPLDKEMVLAMIIGIDRMNPWYSPNDRPKEPDPSVATWLSYDKFGGRIRCTNERNVIREAHIDAYMRYIQTIAEKLFQYLKNYGAPHVSVCIELTAFVKEFTSGKQFVGLAGGTLSA